MMTADEYRARALRLLTAAETQDSYETILALEALAQHWQSLATVADWQDAMLAAMPKADDKG